MTILHILAVSFFLISAVLSYGFFELMGLAYIRRFDDTVRQVGTAKEVTLYACISLVIFGTLSLICIDIILQIV